MGRKKARGSRVYAIHYISDNFREVYLVDELKTSKQILTEIAATARVNSQINSSNTETNLHKDRPPQNGKMAMPLPDIKGQSKENPINIPKPLPDNLKNLPASIVMWLNNPDLTLFWDDIRR